MPSRPSWLLPALLAVQGAVLFALTHDTYFYTDDFPNFFEAQSRGLSWGYLFTPVYDHVAPGHRLVNWAFHSVAPLHGALAKALLVGLLLGCSVLLQRVLAALYGDRPWTAVVAVATGFSIVHIDLLTWWSAGLHSLPGLACSLAAILWYLRHRASGRLGDLALSVGAMVLGLAFYTKVVLVPVYLVLLRHLLLDRDLRPASVARSLWAERWTWAAYAVPTGLYVGYALTTVETPDGEPLRIAGIVDLLRIAWVDAFVPLMAGVRVEPGEAVGTFALVAQVIVAALLAWSVWRAPAAWRGWAVVVLAFAANMLVVGLPRLSRFDPHLGQALRYHTEALTIAAIAVPFAFLGVGRRAAPALGVAALALVLASSLVTGLRIVGEYPGRLAQEWVATNAAALDRLAANGQPLVLADGDVPDFVVPDFWGSRQRLSAVVPLYRPQVRVVAPSEAELVVQADGTVARTQVTRR